MASGLTADAVEAFLLSRSIMGCTALAVQDYLAAVRARVAPITAHKHFRRLRPFFAQCAEANLLPADPHARHDHEGAQDAPAHPGG